MIDLVQFAAHQADQLVRRTSRGAATDSVAKRTAILKEDSSRILARVFPRPDTVNGELARQVGELVQREKWRLEELHTEEGRLDEVFRSITLPETVKEERK